MDKKHFFTEKMQQVETPEVEAEDIDSEEVIYLFI